MPHVPDTLAGWLAAWRPSRNGNPYLRLADGKMLVVFPQTCPAGFRGRVGRTVVDRRWPTAEAAQRDLYDLVVRLSAAALAELHGPVETSRDDRPASDREPRREFSGEPPVDDGELLDALPRSDGFEALRVSIKEYEGRPYVSLRVWVRDKNSGAMWPTRRGVSVRVRELPRVIAALQKAAELATARQAAAGAPAGTGSDRPSARPSWTEALSSARPTRAGFDEFEGQGG